MAELTNYANTEVSGTLTATIEGLGSIDQKVVLNPLQTAQIFFNPQDYSMLSIENADVYLWWPWQVSL
jgi:hypothetical protein